MAGESKEHKPQSQAAGDGQATDELWFDQQPAEPHEELAVVDELLPPYMKATGEPDEEGRVPVEIKVKQDPRFTPEVIEAMKGPVDPGWAARMPDGENRIKLTEYVGSWADGAMDNMANYLNSDKKTHLWHFQDPEGREDIVALDHIAFPADRKKKLEDLGVQLDPTGFIEDMGPIPESAYAEPEPGHEPTGETDEASETDINLQPDPRFTPERVAAIKGKAYAGWVEGDNTPVIDLKNYSGSYKHREGESHMWSYTSPGDEQEREVALEFVKFPQDKRERLEKLGIHLNEEGFVANIEAAAEPEAPKAEEPDYSRSELTKLFESTERAVPSEDDEPEPKESEMSDEEWMKKLNSGEVSAEEKSAANKNKSADEGPIPEQESGKQVSSEGLPESVTNRYDIHQTESGLLVARDASYNRSKTHKSDIVHNNDTPLPIPGVNGPIPEKQRGMGRESERKHPVTGQTYYVVERPGSESPPNEPPSDEVPTGTGDEDKPEALTPQTQTQMEKQPPDEPPENHEREKRHKLDVGIAAGLPVKGEDTILGNERMELFGVFDGMGGMSNGAEASRTAATVIEDAYSNMPRPRTTEEALNQIKHAMALARQRVSEVNGFTTAVFGKVEEIQGKLYFVWGNAGDSRLFLERDGSHESVKSISKEHVMPDGKSVYNALTPEPVKDGDSDKTKYVPYSKPTLNEDDEFGVIELSDGDRIMLCTDGITGDRGRQVLTDKELQDAFDLASAQQVADELVRISRKHDDKSVIVVDVISQ